MRLARRFLVLLALSAALMAPATASAATQIAQTGSPGAWLYPESIGTPGAACLYDGAMGSSYLYRIRMGAGVRIMGVSAALRSVAYRPVLQKLVGASWTNVKYGVLHSATATNAGYTTIAPAAIAVPAAPDASTATYRLALRLIWYNADATVGGTRTLVVSWHRRPAAGGGTITGVSCVGRFSNL